MNSTKISIIPDTYILFQGLPLTVTSHLIPLDKYHVQVNLKTKWPFIISLIFIWRNDQWQLEEFHPLFEYTCNEPFIFKKEQDLFTTFFINFTKQGEEKNSRKNSIRVTLKNSRISQ